MNILLRAPDGVAVVNAYFAAPVLDMSMEKTTCCASHPASKPRFGR